MMKMEAAVQMRMKMGTVMQKAMCLVLCEKSSIPAPEP